MSRRKRQKLSSQFNPFIVSGQVGHSVAGNKQQLLVIEANRALQQQLHWIFRDYEVLMAGDRQEGLAVVRRCAPAVVVLRLELPPNSGSAIEGLTALDEILTSIPETRVVVTSDNADRALGVEVISRGAYDFYQLPIEEGKFRVIVERAFHIHALDAEHKRRFVHQDDRVFPAVVASSPHMKAMCEAALRVGPLDVNILLRGDRGTGKALFAEAIHRLNPRHVNPMVAVNCEAIPRNEFASTLFGSDAGSLEGARNWRVGKIEQANSSTLYLNSVESLPLDIQARLLRVLEENVLERIGENLEIPVDIRVICASHANLEELVAKGEFREDLYNRIKDVTLTLPPLRERQGDAVFLAQTFLKKFSDEFKLRRKSLSREAIRAIEEYHWPGNMAELERKIQRAIIVAEGSVVNASDLELAPVSSKTVLFNLKQAKEATERELLVKALAETDQNISDVANLLGVSRPTVYKLIEKFQLKV